MTPKFEYSNSVGLYEKKVVSGDVVLTSVARRGGKTDVEVRGSGVYAVFKRGTRFKNVRISSDDHGTLVFNGSESTVTSAQEAVIA